MGHNSSESHRALDPWSRACPVGRDLFVLLALFWPDHAADSHTENLWVTCPRKTNSTDYNQGQDDSVTTDRRRPASFSRSVGKYSETLGFAPPLDFCLTPSRSQWTGAAAQSATTLPQARRPREAATDHRRAGVQQPEASSVPGSAPELRRGQGLRRPLRTKELLVAWRLQRFVTDSHTQQEDLHYMSS